MYCGLFSRSFCQSPLNDILVFSKHHSSRLFVFLYLTARRTMQVLPYPDVHSIVLLSVYIYHKAQLNQSEHGLILLGLYIFARLFQHFRICISVFPP